MDNNKEKPKEKKIITNREFSEQDEVFKQACTDVDVKPSQRQASKWRRKVGKAYKNKYSIS